MKKVNVLLVLIVLIFNCIACESGTESITRQKELEFITLDLLSAKLLYTEKDTELDRNGIIIFGHYSDGSIKEESTALAEFVGFTTKNKGVIPITVIYKGKKAFFDITVGDKIETSLEIINYPKTLIYREKKDIKKNSLIDAGLLVNVNYDDETSVPTQNYSIQISTYQNNRCEITLIKGNLEPVSFNVYIYSAYGVSSEQYNCTLKQYPYNTVYVAGDTIDFTGLKIQFESYITYQNAGYQPKIITINDGMCNITPRIIPKDTSDGSYTVTATINGNQVGIPLTINNATFKEIKFQAIKDIHKGELIDFTDYEKFTFIREYNNGDESIINFNELLDGESIKYSLTPNSNYESANKIGNTFRITEVGNKTIYFYYRYLDDRNSQYPNRYKDLPPLSVDIFVHDAVMEKIKAKWKNNKEPSPLNVYDCSWNEERLFQELKDKIKVTGYYTDDDDNKGFDCEYRWRFENFTPPSDGEGEYDLKYVETEIVYYSERNKERFFTIIKIPFKRKKTS